MTISNCYKKAPLIYGILKNTPFIFCMQLQDVQHSVCVYCGRFLVKLLYNWRLNQGSSLYSNGNRLWCEQHALSTGWLLIVAQRVGKREECPFPAEFTSRQAMSHDTVKHWFPNWGFICHNYWENVHHFLLNQHKYNHNFMYHNFIFQFKTKHTHGLSLKSLCSAVI